MDVRRAVHNAADSTDGRIAQYTSLQNELPTSKACASASENKFYKSQKKRDLGYCCKTE